MYDPIILTKKIQRIVVNKTYKKYYRFRAAGFYGGISTADTVGCNLRCKFCWSNDSVWSSKKVGDYYSPDQVADRLTSIAVNKGFNQLRISGGEPTIGREHLIKLLENIDNNFLFILETNGILLGYDKSYVDELAKFRNLHVRVCLKGSNIEHFRLLTGAKNGFEYQLKSLENLRDEKVSFNIAVVSIDSDNKNLFEIFYSMGLHRTMVEIEEIKLYPLVRKRLEKEGIIDYFI